MQRKLILSLALVAGMGVEFAQGASRLLRAGQSLRTMAPRMSNTRGFAKPAGFAFKPYKPMPITLMHPSAASPRFLSAVAKAEPKQNASYFDFVRAGLFGTAVAGAGLATTVLADEESGNGEYVRICSNFGMEGSTYFRISPSILGEPLAGYPIIRHTIYSLESAQDLFEEDLNHPRLRDIANMIVEEDDAELLEKIQNFYIDTYGKRGWFYGARSWYRSCYFDSIILYHLESSEKSPKVSKVFEEITRLDINDIKEF